MRTMNIIEFALQSSLDRIRAHPFLTAARAGAASFEQVQRWIFCAGRESKTFPALLEGLLIWSSDPQTISVLQDNLNDELGNGDPLEAHFQHYLLLLDEMGISRSEFMSYREGAGVRVALDVARHVAHCQNESTALGYMLINEAMTPVVYQAIEFALKHQNALPATKFFQLHVEGDIEHVQRLYNIIERVPLTKHQYIVDGLLLGERAMALLLDEAQGIFAT